MDMDIVSQIKLFTVKALKELFACELNENDLVVNSTKPEFDGDYTIVLFSFVKSLKRSPEQIGTQLGNYLVEQHPSVFKEYNLIKGFLNLTIANDYWINFLQTNFLAAQFGTKLSNGTRVIVEYSSPNTNKPLHLGHLRNNFLGWSVAEILKANGFDVVKTCIVNDRGIHICKSMLAWQLFGNGETPTSTNMKGDHFVGEYYVKFDEQYKKQVSELMNSGMGKEEAEQNAPLIKAAQQMLFDWE